MSGYTEGRAAWLQLEQLASHKATGVCLHCGVSTTAALCASCNADRLDLFRRFGGRAGSNNPRRKFSAPRAEWMPFKDSEDRR